MLARQEPSLPRGPRWRYEPKLDGFRGLLQHTATGVCLFSRNGNDLARAFPELAAAGLALPVATTVDGEIIIRDLDGASDFTRLQLRLRLGPRRAVQASCKHRASFVAFDLLELAGDDLRGRPLQLRRLELEQLFAAELTDLKLGLQTDNVEVAQRWLEREVHFEGVVAKRADGRYCAGRRDWIKVKRHYTIDCVVVGAALAQRGPLLVLGLLDEDGESHVVGVSRPISTLDAEPLRPLLPLAAAPRGTLHSRWHGLELADWITLPPRLVCEVRFAHADAGHFRQAPTFLRWRPDRDAESCHFEPLVDRAVTIW
jgi:ATP-dependent DNA ligase